MVVIAIIAIIAAILFPVFARARENARRASCQSNLKQIGLGVVQYVQDYDETYPPSGGVNTTPAVQASSDSGNDANGFGNWAQRIQPYVKSTQLFACPSNPNNKLFMDGTANAAGNPTVPGYPAMPRSYAANTHYFGWTPVRPVSEAIVNSPSIKIMIAETTTNQGSMGAADWSDGDIWPIRGFSGHLGTMNFLFGDGHVKSMRPTQTMGTVANPYNMWGAFNGASGQLAGPNCTATSWDRGADADNPNCDSPATKVPDGLAKLEKKYK